MRGKIMKEKPDESTATELLSQQDEVFGEAFNEAEVKGEDGTLAPDLTTADDPSKTKIETPPAKVEELPPVDDKKVEPPPAIQPSEPPPPEDFEQKWKSLNGIIKSKEQQFQTRESELLAEIEKLKTPPTPPPADDKNKKVETELDVEALLKNLNLNDEEKAMLKEYDEEFGLVSKVENLKLSKAIKSIYGILNEGFQKQLKEVKEEFQSQLKPATEFVEKTTKEREEDAVSNHFNSIETAHPDYKSYHENGKIVEWIQTKPAYLQKGMLEVVQSGTAEEVISLLDDFYKENNLPTTINPPPDNVVEMDKAKKDRKAALTPPQSKRGAINPNLKPSDDFDGAFDEATSK
jgi:copper chaperone CopZ